MVNIILLLFLALSAVSYADEVPPYVQTQIENLNLQIQELKLQRAQTVKQLENSDNPEMQKELYRAQLQEIDSQIQFLEQQKASLYQ